MKCLAAFCALVAVALSSTSLAQAVPWPQPLIPAANPSTQAKVALGEKLFGETRLSVTQQYSCASCHQPDRHFTDGLPRAVGATGALLASNTPTLYNTAFNASFGWRDRGIENLEAQHLAPLMNTEPVELGFQHAFVKRLVPAGYAHLFHAAFGSPRITLERIVKALASYVRSLRPPVSAFDRYLFYDDTAALSPAALEGLDLFFSTRLGCSGCHAGVNLSGPVRHARAQQVPQFHVTGVGATRQAFRAPTLRAVRHTAPYMHDGSLPDLVAVIRHYQQTRVAAVPDFALDPDEVKALIAFLEAL